jgi:RNA ligase
MTNLYDVIDKHELGVAVWAGYVRTQNHPTEPLVVLNYTNKAQYDNAWNEVTKKTRGLIVNVITDEIVSRPFEKFFNWSQIPAHEQARLMIEPVEASVKWDGSLGVLYGLHTGEHAIATRGSFTSPQALHATEVLRTRYPEFEPILGLTYLFEIVYPGNRIVVDYKDMDDLVLIAVLDTETGRTLPFADDFEGTFNNYDFPGPVNTHIRRFETLADVLAAPQQANEEGFVVRFPGTDMRVKFKFDEYVRLHRILTNVSSLSVWDAMAHGQGIEAFIDHVPDEFYEWVHKVAQRLERAFEDEKDDAQTEFEWIMRHVKRPEEDASKRRKEFALLAQTSPYKDVLFGLYDGKDVSERLWKRVRPDYEKPFHNTNEDVA